MKIQLPDKCPVCGAEIAYKCNLYLRYECELLVSVNGGLKVTGDCADKVLIKFGTTEQTENEEKE